MSKILLILDSEGKDVFEELRPVLEGEPKQFILRNEEYFCLRRSCEDCPHKDRGCEFEDSKVEVGIVPNSRRAIGFEQRPFLILVFKESHSFETLPKDLWNSEGAEAATDERNIHFLLEDLHKDFVSIKGQLRFYGSEDEFNESPYIEYLEIFGFYEREHKIIAVDYSAIEPRVLTLVSREEEYIKVFQGEPMVVAKEVGIEPQKVTGLVDN